MLTTYIEAAMHHAHYEMLEDGLYYGEIEHLRGVFASATTLEACRELLQEVLEGWIVLGLRLGHTLPEVDGYRLEVALVPPDATIGADQPPEISTKSSHNRL